MDSDNVDNDIEFARRNYYDILVKGGAALEEMIEVARATEHPRAYEVFSTMMKTMADVNGNLVDLHKKHKDIKKTDNVATALPGATTNNVFVGSTADLQKMLMKDITPDE
jgi:N-acyl-L-homoserine lactone synthetase